MTYPKGIFSNNPGNIRSTKTEWQGEVTDSQEFEVFESPEYGLRALMKLLISYNKKYGLDTVRSLINRWAPPSENDTGSYQEHVAKVLCLGVDDVIKLNRSTLIKIAKAIVRHENGRPPKDTPFYWYDDATYNKAADMALEGIQNA